jgi:hypothetical protein
MEARAPEGRPLRAAHRPPGLPAHGVDGAVEVLDDVEAVEDELGAGDGGADGVDVRPEHVEAHDADRAAAPGAELAEEALERLAAAPVAGPHEAAAFQVVGQGQIRLALGAADLVDADDMQRAAAAQPQAGGDGFADDRRDRLPVEGEVRPAPAVWRLVWPQPLHCSRRRPIRSISAMSTSPSSRTATTRWAFATPGA